MTEVAIRQPASELAISSDQLDWTTQQLATLQHLGVEGASEGDLRVFFHQAKRTGLDPFAKQIYMIGRNSKEWEPNTRQERWVKKFTIQTGIDGYRLIARRAADQQGEKLSESEPLWCGKDMQWLEAWPFDEPPVAAKVVAYRDGEPFAGVAMYREFLQTKSDGKPNSMWSRMPANQLAKCAEAQALRKAYPQELAGIYVDAEMGPADRSGDGAHLVTSVPSRRVTAAEIVGETAEEENGEPSGDGVEGATTRQMNNIHRLLAKRHITSDDAVRAAIGDVLGRPLASRTELTKADAAAVIEHLEKLPQPPAPEGGEQQ